MPATPGDLPPPAHQSFAEQSLTDARTDGGQNARNNRIANSADRNETLGDEQRVHPLQCGKNTTNRGWFIPAKSLARPPARI